MLAETLKTLGLTEKEITAYDALLDFESMTPPDLAQKINIKRTNAYMVLKSLVAKGVAAEKIYRGNLTYSALEPQNLLMLSKKKLAEVDTAAENLKELIPQLKGRFDTLKNIEGVSFYEGIAGLEVVFEDIIREKEVTYILASNFDQKRKTAAAYLKSLQKNSSLAKIELRILLPGSFVKGKSIFENFKAPKTEIKKAPKELFETDAITIIYGNNLALVSQKTDFSTILIRNKDIAQTQKTIFKNIWRMS